MAFLRLCFFWFLALRRFKPFRAWPWVDPNFGAGLSRIPSLCVVVGGSVADGEGQVVVGGGGSVVVLYQIHNE